jgi:hypothetical protein
MLSKVLSQNLNTLKKLPIKRLPKPRKVFNRKLTKLRKLSAKRLKISKRI